jgi:hypothetical protein
VTPFVRQQKLGQGFAFLSVDNRNPKIRFFCDVGKLVQKHGLPDAAQSNQRRPTMHILWSATVPALINSPRPATSGGGVPAPGFEMIHRKVGRL